MNRNMLRLIVAVLALGCVPVVAQGDGKNTSASPSKNLLQQLQQVGTSYVIGADDTLFVSVWKEPDLTNMLPVRADGMISMPLLNDVQAAGLTPMQLSASIAEKLKKYIEDPRVTVVVTQMNNGRVMFAPNVVAQSADEERERRYFPHGSKLLKPQRGTPIIIRDLEDSPQGPIISVPR